MTDDLSPAAPPRWRRLVFGRNPKRTFLRAGILAVVAFIVFKFILLPVRVSGESMAPTYRDGGVNCVNHWAYRWHPPQRGDVVAVKMSGLHVLLLKRIVGLPGEIFSIEAGVVMINGRPLDEPYVRQRARWQVTPRQLESDEYLVIGDNRGMAQQAHLFGAAKASKIAGKVLW